MMGLEHDVVRCARRPHARVGLFGCPGFSASRACLEHPGDCPANPFDVLCQGHRAVELVQSVGQQSTDDGTVMNWSLKTRTRGTSTRGCQCCHISRADLSSKGQAKVEAPGLAY